jgi:hypothetical protein
MEGVMKVMFVHLSFKLVVDETNLTTVLCYLTKRFQHQKPHWSGRNGTD